MDLKKRAEYHKKNQKGLSPFGIGLFDNPVGSMETFNNSTCMGEELNESNGQEDFNTVKSLLKIASEGSDNEKVKAVSDVVEALPEDAVVELFNDLTEVFNDITLTDKNKDDIANSAGINYEGQGPDLLSKFLDFIDIHQQCKDNPKLVKSVVMVILSIVMILEPTPVVEIILAIISTLPANWISTLVSVLSWLQPGTWLPALANYSYDKSKGKNMVDIKENLNQRDIRTGNAYDLLNLYSSLRLDDNQRNNLIEMLACNSTNESVYNFLASGCKTTLNEDADNYESDGWDDDGVVQGASFFCDGYDWKWIRRIGDVEHLDFDNWAVWMAFRPEDENRPEGRNIVNFFVVDEDTGFIDWGPVETEKEAREFLQSKVSDWDEDYLPESVNDNSLKEELWDSTRVIDLVRYYLDRGNPPFDTLANLIINQMKKEGSALPVNMTDFFDKLYSAVDIYNADLDDDGLDECKNINEDLTDIDSVKLNNEIKAAADKFVIETLGYDSSFANDYIIVVTEDTKFEDSNELCVKVEVRTELDYEETTNLASVLNKIVMKYDPQAYFDHETSNIIVSYLRLDQSDDIVDNEFVNQYIPKINDSTDRDELLTLYRDIRKLWNDAKITSGTAEEILTKIADKVYSLDEKLSKETDPNKKAELEKQIDDLEDEIGDAIDDDDIYAQTSLIKKQQILQEGPKEKSNAKIICDDLNNYLKENGCNVDVGIYDENTLMAGIEWGDWKHDHQKFRNLVTDFFWDINEEIKLKHKITDTDGSDTYSADYKIYLQNEPIWLDAKDIDNNFEVDEDLSEDDLGHILYNNESDRIHIVTKDEALNEERNTVEYNNTKYRINIDGDEIQISSSHPYDDAEYCWAKSKDNGYTFIIYRDGKQIEFFESESEDFSDVLAEMDRLDKDIKPIMVHN